MSGRTFKSHRLTLKDKTGGYAGPDNYFQNVHMVPAPREDNLHGGVNGSSITAAVTFSKSDSYPDEGVGGMRVAAYLSATAAVNVAAATLSLTLSRVLDDGTDYLIATAQATLPALSANATVTTMAQFVDLPFTEEQLMLGNKVLVAGTLTPDAAVANAKIKIDLVKTGVRFEADLATNYLSSMNTYLKTASESLASANSSLTQIDANMSAIETLLTTLNGYQESANASLTAIDGNISAIETLLTTLNGYQQSANSSLTAIDGNMSAVETLLTEINSSIDTLILTATNSIRINEIDPADQKYYVANLANSAVYAYTAPLTTQTFDIGMDGYGGVGFLLKNATTAIVTLNIFGTMDRAAAAGSEVYYNINQEIDSAASTAGWSVGSSAFFTLEDTDGVTGFFKKIRLAVSATAEMTLTLDYKLKQLV